MKIRTITYDFESREDLIKSLKENKSVYKKAETRYSGAYVPHQQVNIDLENQTISYKFRYSCWGDFETATIRFEELDFNKYEMIECL